jgi:hypothetical protein
MRGLGSSRTSKVFLPCADKATVIDNGNTNMEIAEAKLIVNTANEVFDVLEEELGLTDGSPEWKELYDRVVLGTIARRAKTQAELDMMLAV